jgi:hypothetical protein
MIQEIAKDIAKIKMGDIGTFLWEWYTTTANIFLAVMIVMYVTYRIFL